MQEFKSCSRSNNSDSNNTDTDSSSNSYGGNIKRDYLIVIDNVSSLPDNNQKFAIFWT